MSFIFGKFFTLNHTMYDELGICIFDSGIVRAKVYFGNESKAMLVLSFFATLVSDANKCVD